MNPYRDAPIRSHRTISWWRRLVLGWKARRWHAAMRETLRLASFTHEDIHRSGLMTALRVMIATERLGRPYPCTCATLVKK